MTHDQLHFDLGKKNGCLVEYNERNVHSHMPYKYMFTDEAYKTSQILWFGFIVTKGKFELIRQNKPRNLSE